MGPRGRRRRTSIRRRKCSMADDGVEEGGRRGRFDAMRWSTSEGESGWVS